ncbi:MAG: hypothetical protein ACTSVZ_13495 [Promethearchaeota archaeon]
MICTTTVDAPPSQSDKIFTCVTFYNNKLGPRLVGTVEDWNLQGFSKENLYTIVHDSTLMCSSKAILFVKSLDGVPYRVYIAQYREKFVDNYYEGNRYAICVFLPEKISPLVEIRKTLKNFKWMEHLDSNGSPKNLKVFLQSTIEFNSADSH